MDKAILKKKFPSYFPIDLLPKGAKEEELEVYRVCKWGKVEPRAFLNSYEERIYNNALKEFDAFDLQDIGNYSLSCFEDLKDANKSLKFFTRKEPAAILAFGTTTKSYGPCQRTKDREKRKNGKSHVDWWLYEGATPHLSFKEV